MAALLLAPAHAGAVVTHRANGCNLANSGSVTVTKPAGVVAGDVLVASAVSNDGGTITPPAGWTALLTDQPDAASWYKVAGGSEPASYGFTSSSSDTLGVSIDAFVGADPASPIAGSAKSSGSSTSVPLPNASVSRNGSMRWSAVNASPSNGENITFDGGMTRSCWRGGDDAALATAYESASVATTATRTATIGDSDDYWAYTAVVNAALPVIGSISPASGPSAGGQTVTITGQYLTGTTGVTFGGTAGTGVTVVNDTTVTVTTPAHAAGTVDVRVTATPGTSVDAGTADNYTYIAPPSVSGLSPSAGPTAGGTSVVITGTNLSAATSVTFGGVAAAGFVVNSATQITATSPAGAAGSADVRVTTPGGMSANTASDDFTYHAPPTVTGLSPSAGPTAGGTSVVITGTNLSAASSVTFGGVAAAGFVVNSATQITATSPAGSAGAADVRVTTPGGTSANTASDDFTYVAAPTVSGLSPSSGPTAGGTSVVITGTNFSGASAVTFGGTPATGYVVNSATQITATAPARSAGVADVRVTTVGGQSANTASDDYTYVALPTVTGLSPSAGPTAGGTSVVITGTNLTAASAVTFGGTPATGYVVNSATQITATAPARSAGVADVRVTTVGGQSANTAADDYTYVSAPTVTSLSPATGPTAGGTSVVITGTNLTGASAVTFGGTPATGYVVNSATQITATAPAGAGTADVRVTTAGGQSANTAADDYVYAPVPTVTSLAPASGLTTGGTSVTITGTGFTGASAVTFGGAAAAGFVVDSSTQITATTPAGSAGTVDVRVTTAGGQSANTAADDYTYELPCSGGGLTATPSNILFDPFALTGLNGTSSKQTSVAVSDLTASGAGWKLQVGVEQFSAGGGKVLPTNAARIVGASHVTNGGTCSAPTSNVTYPLTLPLSPTKATAYNAAVGTGAGPVDVNFDVELDIPANTQTGTYTSTWTVDIAQGP